MSDQGNVPPLGLQMAQQAKQIENNAKMIKLAYKKEV